MNHGFREYCSVNLRISDNWIIAIIETNFKTKEITSLLVECKYCKRRRWTSNGFSTYCCAQNTDLFRVTDELLFGLSL